MATGIAAFPGRPYNLRIEVWYNWQSGMTASIHTEVWIDGCYGSYSGAGSSFEVWVDGVGRVQRWEGGFDFRGGCNFLIHRSDHTTTVNVNGDAGAQVYANYDLLGYAQTSAWHDGTPATTPGAPNPIGLDQITTTGMRYRFSGTTDGGAPILEWQAQYATTSSFSPRTEVSSSGTTTVSGLTPGTTYYWRSRGRNQIGWGAYSSVISASTLPAVAPGITVSPSLSGLSSTVTLSPPGGVTGVTKYFLEWRELGGPDPALWNQGLSACASEAGPGPCYWDASVQGNGLGRSFTMDVNEVITYANRISSSSNTITVTGLTPGVTYEYRANASFGTYTSPTSNWTSLTQPAPNTNPGNFFDGATAATTDVTYSWTGTANNSTSIAVGNNVFGWRTFAQGSSASGGTGVVARATGGYAGVFAARLTFWSDATAAGFIGGVDVSGAAIVEPGITYFGSVHVRLPARTQRLEGGIAWFTSGNALISTTWGTDVVVSPSATTWTRLSASGVAPANAVKAAPVVRDVSGTSWSLWLGGDQMWMDAAAVTMGQLHPYFDGDSTDTTTFFYAWEGTPNGSPSTRNNLPQIDTDALADPDCAPIPAPPMPPIISSDCITEVGTWRRYTVQVPSSEVALWTATLPTIVLTTGAVAERQVRIRVYPNPDGVAPEEVNTDVWDAELILTYIPPNTVMTLDSVSQRVRAAINGADPIIANQLLYGTDGVPATWPSLRCGVGYVITLDVPLDAPAGNLTTGLVLTSRV